MIPGRCGLLPSTLTEAEPCWEFPYFCWFVLYGRGLIRPIAPSAVKRGGASSHLRGSFGAPSIFTPDT